METESLETESVETDSECSECSEYSETDCEFTKDTTTINDLPDEILTYMFSFLKLSHRKGVKLVCRLWYECATRRSIIENEKFVFKARADLTSVAMMMHDTNYSYLNFQFEDLPMIDVDESVWEACGERVHSLQLVRCRWDDETIKNIILHCENLTNFAIETPALMAESEVGDLGGFFALLSSSNIRRPKLSTFTFFTDFTLLRESVLGQVMSVCPAIRNLNVAPNTRHGRMTAYPQRVSASLDACLNSVTQLESLKFNLRTNGHWLTTLTAKAGTEVRLKRFETVLDFHDPLEGALLDFFSSQKDLRTIFLNMKHCDDNKKLKTLIFHILECCPKLREFYFEYQSGCFHLEPWELTRFARLTSKLQHLTLGMSDYGPNVTPHIFQLPARPGLSILGLIRYAFSMDNEVTMSLLKQYHSLEHLELCVNSDEVLQKIFEYLPRLKTLLMANVEGCTDFGFTGKDTNRKGGFSINRLQDLENLILGRHSAGVTKRTIEHLHLPALSEVSFRMDAFWKLSEEKLMKLGSNIPRVSTFIVDRMSPSMDHLRTVCKSFKVLHFLSCPDLIDKTEFVSELFAQCPQLRIVTTGRNRRLIFDKTTKSFRETKMNPCSIKPRIEDRGFWQLQ